MAVILGMDPGSATGVATFNDGILVHLDTIEPKDIAKRIELARPSRVILEDSRLQSHVWTTSTSKPALAKISRNIGEIDAWCKLIVAVCAELNIPAHSVSPLGKGHKMAADQFQRITGWKGSSNAHERDAAMVAWPYRNAQGGRP